MLAWVQYCKCEFSLNSTEFVFQSMVIIRNGRPGLNVIRIMTFIETEPVRALNTEDSVTVLLQKPGDAVRIYFKLNS